LNQLWKFVVALTLAFGAGSALAADVLIGPGDVLKVTVFNNPELATETRVSESGAISFPLVGEVGVMGLQPADVEKKVASLLERGGFVRKPQVNVLVTVFQSQQISVLGQVNRPGRFPVEGRRTLVDVLAQAGGVSSEGSDMAYVIRTVNGKTQKLPINLPAMMRSGNMEQNPELSGGDVVYVERADRFYIYGEVQRPGTYRLEADMTVVQALSAGGGLTPRGTERGLRIKRRGKNGKMVETEVGQTDTLQPNDVLYVKESLF
jgi:polysaccharide export outer membrane protein